MKHSSAWIVVCVDVSNPPGKLQAHSVFWRWRLDPSLPSLSCIKIGKEGSSRLYLQESRCSRDMASPQCEQVAVFTRSTCPLQLWLSTPVIGDYKERPTDILVSNYSSPIPAARPLKSFPQTCQRMSTWREELIDVAPGVKLETAFKGDPSNGTRLALIAHPLGRLGGTYNDHVVRALAKRLLENHGYSVVLINSRGVGNSQGWASFSLV